jgi:predicted nicotinamide N-methyase
MEKVEVLVVRNLFYNEKFSRKVIPFIKKDYFEDQSNRILFEERT